MGADRVALVLGDVAACRSLAREHVEVVEPEIDHDFVELPLAVSGAQHFLFGQIGQDGTGGASRVPLLRRPFLTRTRLRRGAHLPRRCLPGADHRIRPGRRSGTRVGPLLPLRRAAHHLRRDQVLLRNLAAALRQRLERGESCRDSLIVDPLRVQLLVDVGLQPDRAHPIDVPGPRPEADAVEDVDDGLVVRFRRHGGRRAAGEHRQHAEREQGREHEPTAPARRLDAHVTSGDQGTAPHTGVAALPEWLGCGFPHPLS
jgi:hypothetical protein